MSRTNLGELLKHLPEPSDIKSFEEVRDYIDLFYPHRSRLDYEVIERIYDFHLEAINRIAQNKSLNEAPKSKGLSLEAKIHIQAANLAETLVFRNEYDVENGNQKEDRSYLRGQIKLLDMAYGHREKCASLLDIGLEAKKDYKNYLIQFKSMGELSVDRYTISERLGHSANTLKLWAGNISRAYGEAARVCTDEKKKALFSLYSSDGEYELFKLEQDNSHAILALEGYVNFIKKFENGTNGVTKEDIREIRQRVADLRIALGLTNNHNYFSLGEINLSNQSAAK